MTELQKTVDTLLNHLPEFYPVVELDNGTRLFNRNMEQYKKFTEPHMNLKVMLKNFKVNTSFGMNYLGYLNIAHHCGQINKAIKELQKLLNQTRKQMPEAVELYSDFEKTAKEVNVFQLMMDFINQKKVEYEKEMEKMVEKYGEEYRENTEVDIDVIKKHY